MLGGEFLLISADKLHEEVRRTSERIAGDSRYFISGAARQRVLDALADAEQVADPPAPPVSCRDPKDDYLLACAVAGRAHYLVTGDRDLLALDGHPALGALRIVSAAAFLAILDDRLANA